MLLCHMTLVLFQQVFQEPFDIFDKLPKYHLLESFLPESNWNFLEGPLPVGGDVNEAYLRCHMTREELSRRQQH